MLWRDRVGDFGRVAIAERGASLGRRRCELSPVDAGGGLLKRDILTATEAVGRAGAV